MTATISSTVGGSAGILFALVAGARPSVMAGQGRRRVAVPGGVQQHGFHESSWVGWLMLLLFQFA
jgi:hypothetical protein